MSNFSFNIRSLRSLRYHDLYIFISEYDHGDDSNQSGSSGTTSGLGERSSSGGTSQEIEIVFKLHPNMLEETNDANMKEVVNVIKDNATRYIKTTSKALVEHLCKYLAMR